MIRTIWPQFAAALVDVLSPHQCPLCGGIPAAVPDRLAVPVPGLRVWDRPYLCARCIAQLAGDTSPSRRLPAPGPDLPLVGGAVSHGRLVEIVGACKYHGLRGLVLPLGGIAARGLPAARQAGGEVDLLVPIPLHRKRRRTRGFNQAELLAEVVGILADLPVRASLLARSRNTAQQARISAAHQRQRSRNVASAFGAAPASGSAVRVGLVDDLITTGATVAAAARALLDAGWDVRWALAIGITAGARRSP